MTESKRGEIICNIYTKENDTKETRTWGKKLNSKKISEFFWILWVAIVTQFFFYDFMMMISCALYLLYRISVVWKDEKQSVSFNVDNFSHPWTASMSSLFKNCSNCKRIENFLLFFLSFHKRKNVAWWKTGRRKLHVVNGCWSIWTNLDEHFQHSHFLITKEISFITKKITSIYTTKSANIDLNTPKTHLRTTQKSIEKTFQLSTELLIKQQNCLSIEKKNHMKLQLLDERSHRKVKTGRFEWFFFCYFTFSVYNLKFPIFIFFCVNVRFCSLHSQISFHLIPNVTKKKKEFKIAK